MEDYKPNSFASKSKKAPDAPTKNVEKVISGAKVKKKSGIEKFKDVFISEDVNSVGSYILLDVLVPAVKNAISTIVTNGIDMVLFGETGRSRNGTPASRVSYRNCFDKPSRSVSRNQRGDRFYDGFDGIEVRTRGEAEKVLDRMDELIATYGLASVADLLDIAGVTHSLHYTDNNYGWTDIRSASVVRISDGYWLKLPRAIPLN